ncbi:galactokinase 2 [Salpingoeca rosetta]|uniref:Galactokinase 2 n=1 Tax=Salpingoeca rosetta (strain ATCC 50818 / BSB-021) TaxID=946362 RepID=F2UG01_SALR5|nr:galactokinase 2 [Salpingoeca rosetta]EGD75429.1 galactokinase 2 [Salpingoeca rosetta]|eukprot:XP_004991886.1 galactokinase 2 [Salpingoeca rosetta]
MAEQDSKRSKTDAAVPVVALAADTSLTDKQRSRCGALTAAFAKACGRQPDFICRAPGRVNLIGEHIDYSGYGVLPMAIEQDILIAVAPNDTNTLNISNVNSKFATRNMSCWPVDIDDTKHEWTNYFLAGYRGLLEHAKCTTPIGLDVVVDGVVPTGSGLSSSSAFVVCAALVAMHANALSFPKTELATVCAKAEHYVGTEGGGMDQTISIMAQPGVGLYIQFHPIRATPAQLPQGGAFVIANTLVEANKYVTAGSCYNKRVVECRAAARILAAKLNIEDAVSVRRLGDVQERAGKSLRDMMDVVDTHLSKDDYTQDDIAKELGITVDEVVATVLSPSTKDQTHFNLHDRARHVFSEAQRVLDFKDATTLADMGRLMDESHASCRDQYHCSCPELDQLTALCREAGAYGSRLTGAGWGGSTVSLVPEDDVDAFLAKIKKGYYEQSPQRLEQVDSALFVTSAGPGACVFTL